MDSFEHLLENFESEFALNLLTTNQSESDDHGQNYSGIEQHTHINHTQPHTTTHKLLFFQCIPL